MATKYLELKVVLEPTLMKGVDYLAKVQGVVGVSMLRKLIQESLENFEHGSLQKNTPVRRIKYFRKRSSPRYEFRRDGTL